MINSEILLNHHLTVYLQGGLEGDATMTAFVLISLLECDCEEMVSNMDVVSLRRVLFS